MHTLPAKFDLPIIDNVRSLRLSAVLIVSIESQNLTVNNKSKGQGNPQEYICARVLMREYMQQLLKHYA